MYKVLLFIFLIVVIALISLIMLQHSKCIDMGTSCGTGGISNILLSSSSSMSFMTRATVVLSTLFFIISLALANINNINSKKGNKWENLNVSEKNESTKLTNPSKSIIDIPQ